MSLRLLGVPVIAENITAYNTVAASMFSFYDYIITLREEVELIWRSNLSWVSILFYAIRYLTLFIRIVHLVFCTNVFGLVPVSQPGCLLWVWFQVISGQVLFLSVEILLITRVFAFYGRRRIILAALIILLAAEISAVTALIATTIPKAEVISSPLPSNIHAGACVAIKMPIGFSSLWVPPLIMQGILFSLVIIKFIQTKLDAQTDSPALLVVFVRDDAWAFLAIFAVSLWATLAYELTDHQGEIALTWHYSVLGFCGSRLILNLRSAAQDGTDVDATHGTSADIKFKTTLSSRMSRGVIPGNDAWAVETEGRRGS